MNFARFDLNLLLVFDALIDERSVTNAGRRIGLSQPAVSHALNKLRYALNDELFERGSDGMRPTPRALALAGPIRQTLLQLRATLAPPRFDPATAGDVFNVAVYNYASTMFMAPLAQKLRAQAPGVCLHVRAVDELDRFSQLESGAVDLMIGPFRSLPDGFVGETLLLDTYCGLSRSDHPLLAEPMTIERLAGLPYCRIGPRRPGGSGIEDLLAGRGVELRATMTVPHLFAASAVLRSTDLYTLVLSRVATRHAAIYSGLEGLASFALPVGLEPIPCLAVWHRRMADQPAQVWLRKQIADCFAEVQ